MVPASGHSPLGAAGHVFVSTFSSQTFFNDLQTSPRPRSVSNVSKLDLTLPPEGAAWLARSIPSCPQLEELDVNCDSEGEGELTVYVHTSHLSYVVYSKRL